MERYRGEKRLSPNVCSKYSVSETCHRAGLLDIRVPQQKERAIVSLAVVWDEVIEGAWQWLVYSRCSWWSEDAVEAACQWLAFSRGLMHFSLRLCFSASCCHYWKKTPKCGEHHLLSPIHYGNKTGIRVGGRARSWSTDISRRVTATGMGLLMPSYACRYAHICMQVYVIASDPGPRQSQSYQMFEWCTELFPLLAPSSAVPALPTVRLFCPFPRCSSSMLCLLDLCPWPFCFFHLEDSYSLRTLGKPMCH